VFNIAFEVLFEQHSTLLLRCTDYLVVQVAPPQRHIAVINVASDFFGQLVEI
jgi:hypothetical protein